VATPGQEIGNPLGERYKFLDTAQSTNGELVRYEFWLPPQKSAPPSHFHPYQDERLQVLEGVLRVQYERKDRTLHVGEAFVMRRGEIHAVWNAGDSPAHAVAEIRPAMQYEQFLEDYARAICTGQPHALQLAVIMRTHRKTLDFMFPLNIVLGAMGLIGKLLGYTAER